MFIKLGALIQTLLIQSLLSSGKPKVVLLEISLMRVLCALSDKFLRLLLAGTSLPLPLTVLWFHLDSSCQV
jgi:hypothetical protein